MKFATERNTYLYDHGKKFKHVCALLVAALARGDAVWRKPHGGGALEDGPVIRAAEGPLDGTPGGIAKWNGARLASLACTYALIAGKIPPSCLCQVACVHGGEGLANIIDWVVERAVTPAEKELAANLVDKFSLFSSSIVETYRSVNKAFNKGHEDLLRAIDQGKVMEVIVELRCPKTGVFLDPIKVTELKKLRHLGSTLDDMRKFERHSFYKVFDAAIKAVFGSSAKVLARKLERPVFVANTSRQNWNSLKTLADANQMFQPQQKGGLGGKKWDTSIYLGLNYRIKYTVRRRPNSTVGGGSVLLEKGG